MAVILAVGEFVSAVIIAAEHYRKSNPEFAIAFGLLFAIGAWLLRRRRITAGSVYVGVLCLFEVANFPAWLRHSVLDWVSQTAFAALALAGLIAAIVVFIDRRRSLPGVAGSYEAATTSR